MGTIHDFLTHLGGGKTGDKVQIKAKWKSPVLIVIEGRSRRLTVIEGVEPESRLKIDDKRDVFLDRDKMYTLETPGGNVDLFIADKESATVFPTLPVHDSKRLASLVKRLVSDAKAREQGGLLDKLGNLSLDDIVKYGGIIVLAIIVGPGLWNALKADTTLVAQLTDTVLHQFWPETLHDSIRSAIGLPNVVQNRTFQRKRDPEFRINVLRAYKSTCVICGLDGRLGGMPLGIQAGHIKWHSHNGPDSTNNGLALCPFHHIALDAGAISLNDNLKIVVSADLTGGQRIEDEIYHYEGREIMDPQPGFDVPKVEYVKWHRKEVFRSPGRLLESDDSFLMAAESDAPDY